jgi:hypothetical protein
VWQAKIFRAIHLQVQKKRYLCPVFQVKESFAALPVVLFIR